MNIILDKEVIKRQVTVLKDSLTEEISRSAAYNILSKVYGFESWNALSAFLNNELENK